MTATDLIGGRYELRGVLGRGGMAEVRDGWDTRLHRAVAVKLLSPGFGAETEMRARFEAEARAAAALNHPNVVAVHDSGEHRGVPYIVMERLTGMSLADRIAQGPLPNAMVRSVLGEVLAALAMAHDAGILHRDIKPGNVLFTASGSVKVADFGIAKAAGAALTQTGQVVGTMAYLSPERLMGRPATPADDLYAVGVLGYEALTGRRPFDSDTPGALARSIMDDRPPPVRALRPDADPVLADVVERATARNPAWRFGTARDMMAALAGQRPGTRVLDVPVPPPTAVPLAVPPPPRRRRTLALAGAAVAAVVLAVLLIVAESRPAAVSPSTNQSPTTFTTSSPTATRSTTTSTTTSVTPAEVGPPPGPGPGPNRPPKKPKHEDGQ
jgi:eukaryotic-like serine/threonine-protein kinase